MTGWKITDLLKELRVAQKGNNPQINSFLTQYPLSCVNKKYSLFAIIRDFYAETWKGERMILNKEPVIDNNEPCVDKQKGITIAIFDIENELGGVFNICIPNYNYTNINFLDNDNIIIESKEYKLQTNISELWKKMPHAYGYGTDESIIEAYNQLNNQEYDESVYPQLVHVVQSDVIGSMLYERTHYSQLYEGKIYIFNKSVSISIYIQDHISNEVSDIKKLLVDVDELLRNKFYENALLEMYPTMLETANKYWLEEGEQPITYDNFVKCTEITSIAFARNCHANIYCRNEVIDGGHCIAIDTDEKGNYKTSYLEG